MDLSSQKYYTVLLCVVAQNFSRRNPYYPLLKIMQNISEVMSDKNISLQVSDLWLLVFSCLFFNLFHVVRVYLFMRYISPPSGLHGECL